MRNGKLGVRPGVSLLPNYFKNRLKFAKECQALKLIQSYLFNREIRFTMITLTKLYAKLIIPMYMIFKLFKNKFFVCMLR